LQKVCKKLVFFDTFDIDLLSAAYVGFHARGPFIPSSIFFCIGPLSYLSFISSPLPRYILLVDFFFQKKHGELNSSPKFSFWICYVLIPFI